MNTIGPGKKPMKSDYDQLDSYTGTPDDPYETPVQDADDL